MPGSVVGAGKKVTLTVSTSGIDSGEAADILIYKKVDDKQLDSLSSKVKDNLISAEWEAKGPGAEDKEQGWDVYYKAKCKGLETKATPMFVYTDWVEVESVDEDGKSLPDASFTLKVEGGEERTRTTGTAGKRKEEHLPPGRVSIKWNKPFRLVEWVDEDGPKRKAKLKVVPVARLVTPKKGPDHEQWVNLAADEAKPELGSKLKLKVTLEGGGAKKGSKVYAKLVFDEKKVSDRNDPQPRLFEGGVSADWCKQGGKEGELAGDPPAADHEAVFDLELGLAGGDQVTVWVGGSDACDDESVTITNWRRIYHQITKPKPMKPHDMASLKAALAEVFIEYEKYKTVDIDPADSGIPAGSWMDGAEFGLAGKKLLNIGDHNRDWFRGKFDDSKTPLGCHLILCDKQYDGGPSGAYHEQTIELEAKGDVKEVPINEADSFDVFAKAVQDGNSSILAGSTWTSTAPAGHPMNGKSGDITAAMCTINHHANSDRVKVTLPAGTAGTGTPPSGKTAKDKETKHPVKLKLVVRVARGPFLGESAGKHQLIVLSPNVKAFSATLGHELGHSIRQALKEVAPGLDKSKHPRLYTGKDHQGEHCATGLSDTDYKKASYTYVPLGSCIMYGALSPTQDPPTGKFCDDCLPFVRADDCKTLAGAGNLSAKSSGMCEPGQNQSVVEPSIQLVSVNGGGAERFAPGAETLDLGLQMEGMENQTLTLVVEAANHEPAEVYRRPLAANEKGTGSFVVQWKGDTTCIAGPLCGRLVNPLHGPYTVKVLGPEDAVVGQADVQVLYHSLALSFGKHARTPPPQAERIKYIQWKLDQLGYDAGPVDGTDRPVLRGAIKRFQRAHHKVGTTTLLVEDGDPANADMFAKLVSLNQVTDRRLLWEVGKDPLREAARYYQRDDYNTDRNDDFITATGPEFSSRDRKLHAEDKMERAYLPIQAEVMLVGKGGGAVSAPQAVGPVKVAFGLVDTAQALNNVPSDDAVRGFVGKTYVQRAQQYGGTTTAAVAVGGAARTDTNGDNCPTGHDGWRAATKPDNVKAHFPADADNLLAPWTAPTYASHTLGPDTFDAALVPCFQGRVGTKDEYDGKAALYFRLSTKGGDTARIIASLSFDGQPNKDALAAAHADYVSPRPPMAWGLTATTGTWTVWRRAKFNAYCQQAAPTRPSGNPTWATVREWWRHAFVEIANEGDPELVLAYGTVVPEATYKDAIANLPATHRPAGVNGPADVTYRAGGLYGGPAIAQAAGESASDYAARASSAMKSWVTANRNAVVNAVLKVIHGKTRETKPEGFIIFDYRVHEPVSGQDWDPAANGGAGAWVPTTNPAARDVIESHRGWVRMDGAVTMDVDNPFNVNCYVLHELGHARFLYHHKTGGAAAASDNADDHDKDQDRCAMSYGIAPDAPDQWRYPFCGKCQLRLRGWNVRNLPNQYTA